MPESEELKLSVSFVDNASAGLNKLRTDLDRLGGGDAAGKVKKNLEEIGGSKHLEGFKKTGEHLENLRRQMSLFAEKGSGPLAEGLEKVSRMFLGVGRSGGIALGALGAVGASMYAVQRTATEFAGTMQKLSDAARNTGLGMQQIKNLQNALRDSRIDPAEFDRYTNFVAKFSADIQKDGSQLTNYLRQVAGTNGAVMEQYIGHIRELISKGLIGEAQTEILNLPIHMREGAIKSGKEITRATEEVKEAMRHMGDFPESALRNFERVATATSTQEDRLKGLSEETEKYNKKVAENGRLWGQVYDKLGEIAWAIAKNPMNAMLDATKTALEGTLHAFDAIEQKFRDFQQLKAATGTAESKAQESPREPGETPKQWLERTQTGGQSARQRLEESLDQQYGTKPQPFASLGGGGDITANFPASSNIEDRRGEAGDRARLMGENTAELRKLNDYLTGQFARAAGGGVAGPAAVGLISGGGGASFRGLGGLPGFPGGDGGQGAAASPPPGTGSIAGEGGATPSHTGSGSGAGGASGVPPSGKRPGGTEGQRGEALYQKLLRQYQGSKLVGVVPPDGARFGIKTGSAEEWARFGVSVAHAESSFDPATKNTSDPGGSFGVFQYAHGQVPGKNAYDVDASVAQFVKDSEQAAASGGIRSQNSLLRRRFSTIGSHPERGARYLPQAQHFGEGGATGAVSGGKGTGATSRTIPGEFAADITSMMAAGAQPANIQAYLKTKGVDVSVATCGQFMAAVVKEHGGTPPQGAAVASNWNTFGGKEGAGYSDDPNAINIAVKQGIRTGQTGGHVTAAIPIRDAQGNITGFSGVGVNQGKGRGSAAVAGRGNYGRDVISSVPLTIGTGRNQYQIRHQEAAATAAASRDAIDKEQAAVTHKVTGEANLDINVNAPAGTTLKQSHRGLFRRVRTNRQVQMAPAATGPVNSTAASIEE